MQKKLREYKYHVEVDLGESSRYEPRYTDKTLISHGDSLEELLENAYYFFNDQDGDVIGEDEADDNDSINYITRWYYNQLAIETKQGE